MRVRWGNDTLWFPHLSAADSVSVSQQLILLITVSSDVSLRRFFCQVRILSEAVSIFVPRPP
jgi:hypothetical protein